MSFWPPVLVVLTVAFAISLRFTKTLRGYQFTAWIIAVVTAAMTYPTHFLHVGDFDMMNKWVMLIAIQMVMFGMGTQMSLHDFAGVAKSPRGVFVGIFCHFTVMPLVGLALTKIFHFEPEIAAGIILIGSCSSGLASNVMAYIAKSNLALSVTVTAVTTMIAPIMTPLWMKLLAGTMVEVSFFAMMVDIIKIVLVPIGAALLHDYLKHASACGRMIVLVIAAIAVSWLAFLVCGGWEMLKNHFAGNALTAIGLLGFLLSAFVIGVVYHALAKRAAWLDRFMPTFAIIGILYVTAMTTASGRDNLMKVGYLLFIAAMLHNLAGYFFGYFLSRGAGLDKNSARSIAFEVGLQNGGMASGLASAMGKLGTVGLAAAIFIPWMNISGSILANYWGKRPAK
ncbi:MAG TPA: bile acid:sodium symporter family protein [Candidatus Acidoferrales bacterium]|nr:bile acid:sodium symporter family protein [Candidatus Acidoferrales bacterium]